MALRLNSIKTDPDKRTRGVWKDFGPAKLKIAALNNPKMQERILDESKGWTSIGQEVPAEDQRRIMLRAMAEFVLVDWKDISLEDDDNGDPILLEHSTENALFVLDEFEEIFTFVMQQAKLSANFRQAHTETVEGN